MKDKIHQITGWVLLGIAVTPLLLIVWLQIRDHAVRREMEQRVEKAYLKTTILNADQFSWMTYGKQIAIVGGLFFTVKSFSVDGGQYVFVGLFDEEETDIERRLAQSSSCPTQEGTTSMELILDLLDAVYQSKSFTFSLIELTIQKVFPKSKHYFNSPHFYLQIPTPPPEFLF